MSGAISLGFQRTVITIHMKKLSKLMLAAGCAFLLAGTAVGGEVDAKAPVIVDAVCDVPFSGTVSVGYETDYIFRGRNLGSDAPWASVDLNFALNDAMSVDVGAWYLNSTNNPTNFDELDVYAFLNFPLGPLTASVGGTWFYFPESGGDTGEASLGLAYDLGIFQISGFAAYDFVPDGWYFQIAGDKTIALTDCLDLGFGAGISYGEEYFGVSSFNHAFAVGSLTLHLTESAALSGYVGGNFPLGDLEDAGGEDEVHGGVSISVSFD